MIFVYDHSISPKQNLLRSRGESAETYAGVVSPEDATALSRLTGKSVREILEVDIRFCLDDINKVSQS